MISYAPLWNIMRDKGISTYYLRNKGGYDSVGGSTILRMKAGQSVSTNTIDSLCKLLHCGISDIIEYHEEEGDAP